MRSCAAASGCPSEVVSTPADARTPAYAAVAEGWDTGTPRTAPAAAVGAAGAEGPGHGQHRDSASTHRGAAGGRAGPQTPAGASAESGPLADPSGCTRRAGCTGWADGPVRACPPPMGGGGERGCLGRGVRDVHGRPTSVPGGGERGGPASARRDCGSWSDRVRGRGGARSPDVPAGPGRAAVPVVRRPAVAQGGEYGARRGDAHATPAPGCRCGFYAYGDLAWVGAQPPSRSALAVVALWGEIDAIRPAPVLEPPDSDPLGASRRRPQPPCPRPAGRPARTYRRPRTHG